MYNRGVVAHTVYQLTHYYILQVQGTCTKMVSGNLTLLKVSWDMYGDICDQVMHSLGKTLAMWFRDIVDLFTW